jgi:hypothetical protein
MMRSNQSASEVMERSVNLIRERFIDTLGHKIDNLDLVMTQIELRHDAEIALLAAVQSMHQIVGVARTLGFPELGISARNAEASLVRVTSNLHDKRLVTEAIDAIEKTVSVMDEIWTSARGCCTIQSIHHQD